VLEVVPEAKLRYRWQGGGARSQLDSTVTWTLTATAGGTLLRLDHDGFLPHNAFAFDAMSKGWSGHIADRLRALVAALD
jgi:uncharacterized protein YndB with AHSA1/START domain